MNQDNSTETGTLGHSDHGWRAEGHDFFIQQLFELFATDVILVDYDNGQEAAERLNEASLTIEFEEFGVKRRSTRLVFRVMLRTKKIRLVVYSLTAAMTYICLQVGMSEGFFDSDPLLRIESLNFS